jgi:hypothetical protein
MASPILGSDRVRSNPLLSLFAPKAGLMLFGRIQRTSREHFLRRARGGVRTDMSDPPVNENTHAAAPCG